MKILHIIDSLGLGGAQMIVKGIFEKQRENNDIFLFALRQQNITIEINHQNVLIFNSSAKYSILPLFQIIKIFRKEKINIIHCSLTRSKLFGIIVKLLFYRRIKLVFHEHGEIFANETRFEDYLTKFTYFFSKRLVNLVFAVSHASKLEIVKKSGFLVHKIVVINNFVDNDKFKPNLDKAFISQQKEHLQIESELFVIGFVGRLEKIKGCEFLINALPLLNFKYQVLIAGEGIQRKHLEELSKDLNVFENIHFLGYVKEVQDILPVLNMLVVPSISESFGISALEAQAMKIPVLASDVSGLNEVVIDNINGLLFKPKNVINLAERISYFYNNPEIKNKIIESAFNDSQKYSVKHLIDGLNEHYLSLFK